MKVFISHSASSKDGALAEKLGESLNAAGLDVWYDRVDFHLGKSLNDALRQGLSESDAMVVLLTPSALDSEFIHRDIEYALGEKRFKGRLIPVIVGDSESFPSDRIPWILKRLKTITLPKAGRLEGQFKQIVQVLKDAA
jgi:hypothetical protein